MSDSLEVESCNQRNQQKGLIAVLGRQILIVFIVEGSISKHSDGYKSLNVYCEEHLMINDEEGFLIDHFILLQLPTNFKQKNSA